MQLIRSLALIQWHGQSGRHLSGEAITGESFTQSRKERKSSEFRGEVFSQVYAVDEKQHLVLFFDNRSLLT